MYNSNQIFRKLLLLFWVAAALPAFSQETEIFKNHFGISYQNIDIGQGAQIDYSRRLSKRWRINAGLYYHFNSLPSDDQNHVFRNRGWAENWPNHLGLNLSIELNILKYKTSTVFLFYNLHLLNTGFRSKIYEPYIDQNGNIFYILEEGYLFPPSLTWENAIGVGYSTFISKHIGLTVKGGLGIALFYDDFTYSGRANQILGSNNWEGMYMFSLGTFYSF